MLGTLLGKFSKSSLFATRAKNGGNDELIPELLHLYEKLRKSRTTLNVQGAVQNREMYHMVDRPQQVARDKVLGAVDWN